MLALVSTRTYGQFCGFARALEIVGERWALLIVRDLLVGPKRFGELLGGLPRIPTNVLTDRLKELEAAGLIHRRALPKPPGGVAYELTERGAALEEAVLAIGRWGAKLLDAPRDGEIVTGDSLVMALRTTFKRSAAEKLRARYELHVGDIVLHAVVNDGALEAGKGPIPDADLVIHAGPGIKDVMSGEITPRQALANDVAHIDGPRKLFDEFAKIFRI